MSKQTALNLAIKPALQAKNTALFVFLLLVSLTLAACGEPLPTRQLTIGNSTLTVELAVTPAQRELGLMNRKSMAQDHGMLFIFPYDQPLDFWMKNTSIPLSIAFIGSDGVIKTIRDMKPFSLEDIGSNYSVRYALEVNQGYFDAHGISVGSPVTLPEDLPKATK